MTNGIIEAMIRNRMSRREQFGVADVAGVGSGRGRVGPWSAPPQVLHLPTSISSSTSISELLYQMSEGDEDVCKGSFASFYKRLCQQAEGEPQAFRLFQRRVRLVGGAAVCGV